MNTNINDGGPAFPTPGEEFIEGPQGRGPASAWGMEGKPGMSLRDWFAGQALAGMLPSLKAPDEKALISEALPLAARLAYVTADAMLAARSKEAGR
jgi:hypothetical protein